MNTPVPDVLPTVTFTITKFHKIGGKKSYCDYTMSLANGGTQVALDTTTNTLTVTSGTPVQIVFTAKGDYILAGICFKETDEGKGDPNGVAMFPEVVLCLSDTTSSLTLTDQANTDSDYEFAMLVVDTAAKALGMIDPPIVNRPPA